MRKYSKLLIISLIIVVSQVIIATIIYFNFDSWTDRGTFGDMFGAINTLFSGLAFAGVVYAIFLQSNELELQREELHLTRTEIRKSADSQADQVKLMVQSAKLNALSSKLDTYTSLSTNEKIIPGMEQPAGELIPNIMNQIDLLINDVNHQFTNEQNISRGTSNE